MPKPKVNLPASFSKIEHYFLELELEVKRLQSLGNFSNNDAIVRLEDLLKNEENMRREIEKTARNLKMELQEVQKSNALKEAEMALMNQKLSAAEMSATRINKELELKLKIENELKKQGKIFIFFIE